MRLAAGRHPCMLLWRKIEMEAEPLKILFIGNDRRFADDVADAIRKTGGTIEVSTFDTAIPTIKNNSFCAILFEPVAPNAGSLFQITSLTVQAPQLPVIVVGSAA